MEVPLGSGTTTVDLPECDVTRCAPPSHDPVDVDAAVEQALSDPLGPPLAARVDPDDTVAIVVTDITRATPDEILIDAMLAELQRGGVAREQVSIVVGLGLHRPLDQAELRDLLGPYADLAENHDPAAVESVGTVDGCEITIHETVAAADRVLSTGMVEPHQYAGFSGGAKTAVIGAGGESQIGYTHGPALISQDGVRLGRIDDNPFRSFLDRAGDVVGVDFCCNVTHGPDGFLGAAAGDPRRVVETLAETAREALAVEVSDTFDAIVAGVGAPKDANLYQASRAATYIALGARNPLVEGGRLVVPATLPEGAGSGTGEQRFYQRLGDASDAQSLYTAMLEGYDPGAQRAFVVARVLRDHDIWITNSAAPDVVEDCLMHHGGTVADAVPAGSRVLVVTDALNTLLV
jgi:nickel-dependent lactate racemase